MTTFFAQFGWVAAMLLLTQPVAYARAESAPSAGAVARRPPPHPMPIPALLTVGELRAALQNARPDMEECTAQVVRTRALVRVSIHPRRGLTVNARVSPSNESVRQCLDIAARRWTIMLEGRPMTGTISASLRIGPSGVGQPPPPPPPPNNNAYDDAHVHAALDRQRLSVLGCVPRLSPGTPGTIVLRMSVRPDGSLALEGATLPSGLGAPETLVCLGALVAAVRVPAPSSQRSVTHTFQLGR